MLQFYRSLQRVHGALLFVPGLAGDCLIGMLFAARGGWPLLLWHVPFALIWALGVDRLSSQGRQPSATFPVLNRWGLTSLLVGMGTFPGLGSGAYSLAFLLSRRFFAASPRQKIVSSEPESAEPAPRGAEASTGEDTTQMLADDLYEGNTEARRAVVARLSRAARPETNRLLRQLLSDAQAEIRSDASIALTRLDEEMSRALNASYAAWHAQPTDTALTLTLVEHYYHYAASNVLDNGCQRFYLGQARALLQQIGAQTERQDMHAWPQLVRLRQRLDELPDVLQDASRAIPTPSPVEGARCG